MRIFDLKGGKYFCGGAGHVAWPPRQSFRQYLEYNLDVGTLIREGQTPYPEFRGHALPEAERLLFLSLSNYRRALDLLSTAAVSWCWVTAYYSSYYAASAVLGMLGGSLLPGKRLVEVVRNSPKGQELKVGQAPTQGPTLEDQTRNSHRLFWDLYYDSMLAVRAELPRSVQKGALPIDENPTWQINARTSRNYDSFEALASAVKFSSSFDRDRFPTSLDSELGKHLGHTVEIVDLAVFLAHEFNLQTDALADLGPSGNWQRKAEELIGRGEGPFDPRRDLFRRGVSTPSINY